MSLTLSSRFADYESADAALARLERDAEPIDSIILESGRDAAPALDAFGLPADARAACEDQLLSGGCLLVLRVADQGRADFALDLLDAYAAERAAAPEREPEPVIDDVQEEADPRIESETTPGQELRIGAPVLVRGGVCVRFPTEALSEASDAVDEGDRPGVRRLAQDELAGPGLFEGRTIEVSEMRERPVVSKHAFVREELVVRSSATERVEQFDDNVRHTEFEVEELAADERPALAGAEDRGG